MAPAQVRYLGHSTLLIELGDARLLTDPLLRRRVGPLGRSGPVATPASLGALDAVLISHPHRDHLDLPSLRALDPATRVLAPRGCGSLIERAGLRAVTEVDAGDEVAIAGAAVTVVPAVHEGPRTPFRSPFARALGYVVEGARRVYFAGDTELFRGMAELAPLDAALLPVWGWGPTLGPGHMDPAEAAEALTLLRPRIAVPIHWGTLHPLGVGRLRPRWLTDPPHRFARLAAESAPEVEVRILDHGESIALESPSD